MSASATIGGYGGGSMSMSSNSTKTSSDSKTKISIKAFGIGLNSEGADTLAARSLEDYDKAIKFAFKSMQNDDVGQIHGLEVVSWMNNLQFQNAVQFDRQELITWDVPWDPTLSPPGPSKTLTTKVRGVQKNLIVAGVAEVKDPQTGVVTQAAVEEVYEPEMVESIEVKSITMINARVHHGARGFLPQGDIHRVQVPVMRGRPGSHAGSWPGWHVPAGPLAVCHGQHGSDQQRGNSDYR